MKSTIISMLIVLIILTALPVLFLGDNDLLEKMGLVNNGAGSEPDSIASLKARAPKNLTHVTTDKKVKVYKWVDENGVTQFSQTPPQLGGAAESLTLKPDTNIMQAYKPPAAAPQAATGPKIFKTSPYTPEGMKNVVEETVRAKDQINQRQQEQNALLDQIMGKQK